MKERKKIKSFSRRILFSTIERLTQRVSVIRLLLFRISLAKLEQWNERRDNDIGYQIRSKELYYTALWIGPPAKNKQ